MRSWTAPLVLLFIALGHPSYAQSGDATTETNGAAAAAAAATSSGGDVAMALYHFNISRAIVLNCTLPQGTDVASAGFTWTKNGTDVEQLSDLQGRYATEEGGAVFKLARAHEDDYGNYSCRVGGEESRAWQVEAVLIAKLPPNSNVVEGQNLKLTCKLIGKPYRAVRWLYADEGHENGTDVLALRGERAAVHDSAAGVPGGELVLTAAERADAGVYTCAPAGGAPASTTLRVKDMYAALWPFLGICLEVFVLCAIILVYEKRRTKTETEDSDTENHEQKKS